MQKKNGKRKIIINDNDKVGFFNRFELLLEEYEDDKDVSEHDTCEQSLEMLWEIKEGNKKIQISQEKNEKFQN